MCILLMVQYESLKNESNGFRDDIQGDDGNDVIYGDSKASNHNYTPVADEFNDSINAGKGIDTVDGGVGTNTCTNAETTLNCL